MNNKQILAVLAVVVVVVAAISAAVIMNNSSDKSDSNEDNTSKGGFYSWNPKVVTVNDGYSNLTPAFMSIAETVFESVYGDVPDYSGIKISDIPEQYLFTYTNYVTAQSGSSITVKTYDNTSTGTHEANVEKTISYTPTKILCYTDTYIDTIYMILCDYYGETAHSGNSDKAETKLWELIPAVSSSIKTSLKDKFGLTVPDSVGTLGTGKEDLVNYCSSNFTSDDKVIIFMSEYNIRSTNSSSWWTTNNTIENNNDNIRFIYLLSNSPAMVLSSIEMVGKAIGFDNTSSMMTSILAEIYVMQKAINESGNTVTFYAETAAKKSVGSNTLMGGIMTQILGLINVYDGSLMGSLLSDEKIAHYKPAVLIFYKSDKRTADEQMRIA